MLGGQVGFRVYCHSTDSFSGRLPVTVGQASIGWIGMGIEAERRRRARGLVSGVGIASRPKGRNPACVTARRRVGQWRLGWGRASVGRPRARAAPPCKLGRPAGRPLGSTGSPLFLLTKKARFPFLSTLCLRVVS